MTSISPPQDSWQIRVFVLFSILGAALIALSFVIGAFVLAPTAADYFGVHAKEARDSAAAGSALLSQLQLLEVTPRWLTPLTFLGVASFMLGIALEFSTIPRILKNRGKVMRAAFPLIVEFRSEKAEVPEDPKPGMPFRMIEGMMPLFPVIAVMGWLIVGIAFLVALLALSPAQATFFSEAKAVREAAGPGSAFVQANLLRHSLETWVPEFKFFGLGLALMAITMALGTIAKRLRRMGYTITSHIPEKVRPKMPPIPKVVRVFQLSTVMGVMILLGTLVVGIVLAAGVVPAYWGSSIAETLNPAQPGSVLLNQLALIRSSSLWLEPTRMLGMAFLFTGITLALTVIIKTLKLQAKLLVNLYRRVTQAA